MIERTDEQGRRVVRMCCSSWTGNWTPARHGMEPRPANTVLSGDTHFQRGISQVVDVVGVPPQAGVMDLVLRLNKTSFAPSASRRVRLHWEEIGDYRIVLGPV